MTTNYIIDMNNIDADMQGAIITLVKNNPITTDEVIARAYEWLDKKHFIEFMDWWKMNDYKPLICGMLDNDCEKFIVAVNGLVEVRIVWWEC